MKVRTKIEYPEFFSVLVVVFIVLKLCGVIHWSWGWVLAPFWIPLLSFFCVLPIVILLLYYKEQSKKHDATLRK